MTTVTPEAPWGDIPLNADAPTYHFERCTGLTCCGLDSSSASGLTNDPEAVTCANCLAAMTAPITEDHGPVQRPEPDLSTPEGRWAYVLTLWRTENLPTPTQMDVGNDLTVWLPRNERGQVDQWVRALGIEKPPTVSSPTRKDGCPNPGAYYSAHSYVGCREAANAKFKAAYARRGGA